MADSGGAQHRDDVDGLRAFAVLAVLGYHFFPDRLPGGFIGVDVFFVISGFLITRLLIVERYQGRYTYIGFFGRRVRRLAPVLLLVLVATLATGWFTLLADEMGRLGREVRAAAGFVSNLVFWRQAGYFDPDAERKLLLHTWSLAVEEQFYLVWPLVLAVVLCWRRLGLMICGVAALISFGLSEWTSQVDPSAAYFLAPLRLWEFLAGSAALWVVGAQRPHHRLLAAGASVGGLLLLLGAVFLIRRDLPYPGVRALAPVLGASLVLVSGPQAWLSRKLWSIAILVWLGRRSYPLYLWHWPILALASTLYQERLDLKARLALVLLAVGLAMLSHAWVEQPCRRRSGPWMAPGLLVGLALTAGLAWQIERLAGVPQRRANLDVEGRQAFEWPDSRVQSAKCRTEVGLAAVPYCMLSGEGPPTVALLGDSHANALFELAVSQTAAQGRSVVMLGKGGCPPFVGIERDRLNCPAVLERALAYVEAHPDIQEVWLAARFALLASGTDMDGRPPKGNYRLRSINHPQTTRPEALFIEGLAATLDRLHRAGRRVVLVHQVPELGFDPRQCLPQRSAVACRVARADVERRQSAYRALVAELQAVHGFRTLDPVPALCSNAWCDAQAGSSILYRDRAHLGPFGTRHLAEVFGRDVRPSASQP